MACESTNLSPAGLPPVRPSWCSQELPAVKARLRGVQDQVEPPTQAAAQALQDFIQHIEIDKVSKNCFGQLG